MTADKSFQHRNHNPLNTGLQLKVVEIRKKGLERRKPVVNVKSWTENFPLLSGKAGKAIVLILPTRGCYLALSKLGGCSMCSYLNDNPAKPSPEDLFDRFRDAYNKKITSDEPLAVRDGLFRTAGFPGVRLPTGSGISRCSLGAISTSRRPWKAVVRA